MRSPFGSLVCRDSIITESELIWLFFFFILHHYTDFTHILGSEWTDAPHIIITNDSANNQGPYALHQQIDFTLHEDFAEMAELFKCYNAKTAVVVHCAPEIDNDSLTIEQVLMLESECKTQFIFAENYQIYKV